MTIKVVIHNDRLALELPGQQIELELYPPDDEGKLYIRINPTVAVSFSETDEGESILWRSTFPTEHPPREYA